ncbi:MAG: hypothetical protein AVO33_06915 [delta proteobacterium ML8_F1]|nr:MAG: hypothetical protein AVO33_06915 [delta proteobacterium ML8_F1]
MWDVIIVGAGPSGLMAGVTLEKDLKVLIIEKNEMPGKKLLASGGGRCNLTHTGELNNLFPRYNARGRYIKRALSLFDNRALMDFFTTKGLSLTVEEGGRVFPASYRARDVLEVFLRELRILNRRPRTGVKLRDFKRSDTGFTLITDGETLKSRYLVLATGGITYPTLGTTGEGHALARATGHELVPTGYGLSSIRTLPGDFKTLQGLSLKAVKFHLYKNSKKFNTYRGDLLFTHEGLSGPGILSASRDFAVGDTLHLDLEPPEDLFRGSRNCLNSMKEIIPASLGAWILENSGIGEKAFFNQLGKKEKTALLKNLSDGVYTILEIGGPFKSMVTTGGVSFKDVSLKTLESRKIPGLYFAGEVLDVDGESGGYNLQAAFSMGHLVAETLNQRLKPLCD